MSFDSKYQILQVKNKSMKRNDRNLISRWFNLNWTSNKEIIIRIFNGQFKIYHVVITVIYRWSQITLI